MQRPQVRLTLVCALVLALAVSGTVAFAAVTPDFDVFRYWSSSWAPYIANVGGNPQAYLQMDLNELSAVALSTHWSRGGWYIHGPGVSSRFGDYDAGSHALGTVPVANMTVRLKYYDVSGGTPPSDAWSLKAQLSNNSWVGLGWLDRGTWSSGHYQDFAIPTSVVNDLNAGSSKVLNLAFWYSGQDCHVKLAGIKCFGSVVPEPTSMALMGLGVIGLIGGAVRKRRLRAG